MQRKRRLHLVEPQALHFPRHHLHLVIPPPLTQHHLPLEIPQRPQHHLPLEMPQRPQHLGNPPLANLHSANLRSANLPLVKLPPQVVQQQQRRRRRRQVHSVNLSTTRVLYPHFRNPNLNNLNNKPPRRPFSGNPHKERQLPPLGSPRRLAKRRPRHLLLNLQQRGRLVLLLGHPVHLEPMLRRHLLRTQEAAVVAAGFQRSLVVNHLLLDSEEDRARRIRIIHKTTQDRCLVKRHLDNRPTRRLQQRVRRRRRLERVCLGRQHRDLDLFLVRLLLLAR